MFALLKKSDAYAVRQVLSGRRDTFNLLVERYLPAVYAVSYAQLHNHADAEDATQEAFLSAFTTLHNLREPTKFEGWVVSMARRIAIGIRQKKQRDGEGLLQSGVESAVVPDMARDELRRLLRREIEALDDDAREILLLHYFTGKTTGEIAVSLDISREAAKKRLQRARQALSENLLVCVEEESQPRKDYRVQQKGIMGLVAVAAVGCGCGAGAATGGLVFTSTGSAKVIGLMALAAVLAGGGIYLASRGGDLESDAPSTEATATIDVAPEPFARALEVPDALVVTEVSSAPMETPPEAPATEATLSGLWKACDNLGLMAGISLLHVEQSGDDVSLRVSKNGEPDAQIAIGSIQEGTIRLEVEGGNVTNFSGKVDADDFLVLAGDVSENGMTMRLEVTLTRLSERDLAEVEIQARRIAEIDTVMKAIQAYANVHDQERPATLAELSPQFLQATQLIESSPSRKVVYAPNGIQPLIRWTDHYADIPSHVEQLQKLEADRQGEWPGFPSMPALLTIQYAAPPMLLECRSIERPNAVRVDSSGRLACPRPAVSSGMKDAAMQASCANNMKQLGLVLKMFQAEDAESRFPAGWATPVPDYLVDTMVLTCPSLGEEDGPGRTVSYDLLFPTAREDELLELAGETGETPASQAAAMSMVPLIVENHPCSDSGGSHVLFLDGHVELIQSDAWEERVAPYLN